jgi:hypothetical protein
VLAPFVAAYLILLAGDAWYAAAHASTAYLLIGLIELLGIGAAFFLAADRGHRWPVWLLLAVLLATAVGDVIAQRWVGLAITAAALGCWTWGFRSVETPPRGDEERLVGAGPERV